MANVGVVQYLQDSLNSDRVLTVAECSQCSVKMCMILDKCIHALAHILYQVGV